MCIIPLPWRNDQVLRFVLESLRVRRVPTSWFFRCPSHSGALCLTVEARLVLMSPVSPSLLPVTPSHIFRPGPQPCSRRSCHPHCVTPIERFASPALHRIPIPFCSPPLVLMTLSTLTLPAAINGQTVVLKAGSSEITLREI